MLWWWTNPIVVHEPSPSAGNDTTKLFFSLDIEIPEARAMIVRQWQSCFKSPRTRRKQGGGVKINELICAAMESLRNSGIMASEQSLLNTLKSCLFLRKNRIGRQWWDNQTIRVWTTRKTRCIFDRPYRLAIVNKQEKTGLKILANFSKYLTRNKQLRRLTMSQTKNSHSGFLSMQTNKRAKIVICLFFTLFTVVYENKVGSSGQTGTATRAK